MLLARLLSLLRTIRVRLTLWYVGLLALIFVAFSGTVYLTLSHSLYVQVDDNLGLTAQQLVGTVNRENGHLSFAVGEGEGAGVEAVRARGFLVRLLDSSGQVLDTNPGYAALPVPALNQTAGKPGQPEFATFSLAGETYRSYTVLIEENGRAAGAIQIARSLQGVVTTLRQLLVALILIVPLTVLVASAGGVLFAGRALAPVDQITRAAQRISAHDLSQRLNLRLPDDEMGRLAYTFDGMLARLDDAFRREREFTANASHELRTPLTVMRGEIDVALRRTRSVAEYRRTLTELGADVERLTRLAEDLLMLARADVRQLPVAREELSAPQILDTLVDEFRPLAEAKKIELELRTAEALVFWGDKSKTLRVFSNLVENALKFSEAGSRVILSAAREGDGVALAVTDYGRGIPASDLPHIFDRFYRGQDGRTDGAGLGLAIARALVLAQGGTLTVESEPGRGTTCTVKLPLRSF